MRAELSQPALDGPAAPVTVIIPTWRRHNDLISTLNRILSCRPHPDEILIHVDYGDDETAPSLEQTQFPIRVFKAKERLGPGGGRHRLLHEARHEIVASFDDDSYPLDQDYFARLLHLSATYPQAAVFSSQVFFRGDPIRPSTNSASVVTSFIGCGCAYRRSVYLSVRGYLPLAVAYGAEEKDLSLQLFAAEKQIVASDSLRVYHDTELEHHAQAEIVAGTIANRALIAYLHYPATFLPKAILQIANSVFYAVWHGRYRGIVTGLMLIPQQIFRYRAHRKSISRRKLVEYMRMRRKQGVPEKLACVPSSSERLS